MSFVSEFLRKYFASRELSFALDMFTYLREDKLDEFLRVRHVK